ncbi:MAG: polysaccharide biosynthesis C-terminal domain-containing protein, partial [Cyanobacteria bacterium REEB65]|nr:polysaccharide biosynthesis C-terminal domain-containing protein [Cyanobacteria bacterium REEB65]
SWWAPHSAIAQYVLAYGLASTAMKALPGALVPLLVPAMARAADRQSLAQTFQLATRWLALLAIPTAIGLALVARPLVLLLYGHAYVPAIGLLAPLVFCTAAVMALGYPASSVLYATDGAPAIARVGVAVAALNVLLAILLIPPLGALGAVFANCGAQLASLGPGLWLAFRRISGRLDPRHFAVPLAAATIMAVPVAAACTLPAFWALAIGIPAGAITYGGALLALRGISIREARALLAGHAP